MALPKSITKLSESISRLPGIGPKSALRIAIYLSSRGKDTLPKLINSIEDVSDKVTECSICSNLTEVEDGICDICSSGERDSKTIIIVEDSIDLYNIEMSETYNGKYQVLGGVISPLNGVGPQDLNMEQLRNRIREMGNGQDLEIIFGLNPTIEGESTCLYIKDMIMKEFAEVRFSQLARGIPTGSDIEYLSGKTLAESLKSRTPV